MSTHERDKYQIDGYIYQRGSNGVTSGAKDAKIAALEAEVAELRGELSSDSELVKMWRAIEAAAVYANGEPTAEHKKALLDALAALLPAPETKEGES